MSSNANLDIKLSFAVDCPDSEAVSEQLKRTPNVTPKTVRNIPQMPRWIYSKTYQSASSLDDCLEQYTAELNLTKENADWLKARGECTLRISFISDYGQFGTTLSSKSLRQLAALGITVEFSVFSWGLCPGEAEDHSLQEEV